ncbi:MAG: ROK family protein [Bacteroidales bacterium]|nr:ROK family protein [Bacteroidales bacterium]
MEQDLVLGIDIGGQSSKLGVVNARGTIIERDTFSSKGLNDLDSYINALTSSINALIEKVGGKERIKGIGVGAPNGNFYKGTIEYAPNLTWGRDKDGNPTTIDFANIVSEKVGVPVILTNDANAAAVGEMTYGAARGMKNFIEITLGTGVGSGIVIGGYVLYGHDGFAGELGHTTAVRGNGRRCGCGRTGCLETYASAIGVARTAREMLESQPDRASSLRDIPLEEITSKDVAIAAANGDELSKDVFKFTGTILGRSLADFVAFSAPEAIVLFGGLCKAGDLILKPTVEALEANVLTLWKNKVKVIFSTLDDSDAAILGAGALAW